MAGRDVYEEFWGLPTGLQNTLPHLQEQLATFGLLGPGHVDGCRSAGGAWAGFFFFFLDVDHFLDLGDVSGSLLMHIHCQCSLSVHNGRHYTRLSAASKRDAGPVQRGADSFPDHNVAACAVSYLP